MTEIDPTEKAWLEAKAQFDKQGMIEAASSAYRKACQAKADACETFKARRAEINEKIRALQAELATAAQDFHEEQRALQHEIEDASTALDRRIGRKSTAQKVRVMVAEAIATAQGARS